MLTQGHVLVCACVRAFLLVLLPLPRLKVFSLTGNQIGETGLGQLSVGLEGCHQLTGLWLDSVAMIHQKPC